jgi:glycosyltransferase involved in cell wall biosynthesis
MKVLVVPQDKGNPYQDLLYGEMGAHGAEVTYIGLLTSSYTLNLLLQPLELVIRRLTGARVLHLHWVYNFAPLGSSRFPFLRAVAQVWFSIWLWIVRRLDLRLVWTAHNVLPSSPVFADDLGARKKLVDACDLVIVHSKSTLDQLAELGIAPRKSAVIPHGPFAVSASRESLRTPGAGPGPRRLLFFGRVQPYKGVGDLLSAHAALPPGLDARLMLAGECTDPSLKEDIRRLVSQSAGRVEARLERISDAELSQLLDDADAVVLPFRQITTSGSAMLALCHGRPLIVPDLPGLASLPNGALTRYDGTVPGLTSALADIIGAEASVLARMSAQAIDFCSSISWSEIAAATFGNLQGLADGD